MKSKTDAYTKLEKALIKAHQRKETKEENELWLKAVMRHIRILGSLAQTTSFELFGQFVWRLTPIAGILIVLLTMCILYVDFVPEYTMAKIFVDDHVQFTFLQTLSL
jgi:hypothetical protein